MRREQSTYAKQEEFFSTLLLGIVVVANASKCQWLWRRLRLRPGFCLWFRCLDRASLGIGLLGFLVGTETK